MPIMPLLVALCSLPCLAQHPADWPDALADSFDGGTLFPDRWRLTPDASTEAVFEARGEGKAVHFRSDRGDNGMCTAVSPAPPYRLSFEFLQPGNEAGGYRLVVMQPCRDGNAWWFEFDKGAYAVWTTAAGGWAPRWSGPELKTDAWYRVVVDDEPGRVRLVFTDESGAQVADSGWLPHDELSESGSVCFTAASGGGLRGAMFDNVRLQVPVGKLPSRVAVPVDPALHAALAATVAGQETRACQLATEDGLELTVGADAVPVRLVLEGKSVAPEGAGYGGFYAWDVAEDPRYCRFGSAGPAPERGLCQLSCAELGLGLDARFEAKADRVEVTGELRDLRGQDRGIVLMWVLPLEATGWQWGDTLDASRTVGEEGRYHNNLPYGSGGIRGRRLVSTFPWGSLGSAERGLMVARPLDWPRIMSWWYDYTPGRRFLAVRVELGLSPLTRKFPSSASFRFALARLPQPEWGMRAAAQRYYQLYPQCFTKRVAREGIWHLWVTPQVPQPEDFALMFHEQEPFSEDRVTSDDTHGEYSCTYSETNTLWQHASQYGADGQLDVAAFLAEAKRRAAQGPEVTTTYPFVQPKPWSDAETAQALLNSYLGSEGQPGFYPSPPDRAAVNCNGDPELPQPNRASLWFDYEGKPALEDPRVDGAYLDSVGWHAFDVEENSRREQWATADYPLVPSFRSNGPTQLAVFAHLELYQAISDAMHERGKIVIANSFPYSHLFVAQLLDMLGAGEAGNLETFHEAPKLSFCRALSYHKPVSHMNYAYFDPQVPLADKERALQRDLVYCVWPGSGNVYASARLDSLRPLYARYMPIFRKLAAAGWEPITYAHADAAHVVVERYGTPGDGPVYLAVHNPTGRATATTLTLTGPLADRPATAVRDEVAGAEIARADGKTLRLELRPWQTLVLGV